MISSSISHSIVQNKTSQITNSKLSSKRMNSVILVLASQLLLLAMAVAWCVHMVLIAKHGKIFFAEPNPVILYGEIAVTALIALFAITIFVSQWKRLWYKPEK